MELERTKEMDELCERALHLAEEKVWYEEKARQSLLSVMIFGVLGIFFFPCLVIAGLCYCLHRWGLAKAQQADRELERLDRAPGLDEYFRYFYQNPQA